MLSGRFGIIGLIYANCVNMGVRAVMSLKIALEGNRDKVSVVQVFGQVVQNKVFLGLVALGIAGTIACKFGINYILVHIL